MSSNYTDLDLDHKKELLVNLKALLLAVRAVSNLANDDCDRWANEIWKQAYLEVTSLSDADIHNSIAAIESNRKPFTEPGAALIQKLSRS